MIKKKTSLFFTILVNIVLLALAVVPHHHHDSNICIINHICHSDHEDNHNNNTRHNHDNNVNDDNHFCLLEQEIILRSNNLEHLLKTLDSADNHPGFDGFWNIPNESVFISYVPPEYSNIHFGLKSSLYFCFVSLSQGLRGPPTA